MDKMFVLSRDSWQISPDCRIIRKEELGAWQQAQDMLQKSRELAAKKADEAEQAYEKRQQEGYEAGLEDGKSEYTMKIMEMVMAQVDSLEGLEKQLVQVVISSVRKIIGDFDQNELIVRVVRQALNAVRGEKRILVRVSLADEAAVRADLQPFLLSPDGSQGYIEVLGDASFKRGDCVLETQMGVVEGSVSSQLSILEKTLKQRVGDSDGA